MDKLAKNEIIKFYEEYKEIFHKRSIADMGAFNINGSVKEILFPFGVKITGFDIIEGKGVDIVIKPGEIPPEQKNKYLISTIAQSFQFCPYPDLYKKQIKDILEKKGFFLLITCVQECKWHHTTTLNKYWEKRQGLRWSLKKLGNFFEEEFDIIDLYRSKDIFKKRNKHPAYILKAQKK